MLVSVAFKALHTKRDTECRRATYLYNGTLCFGGRAPWGQLLVFRHSFHDKYYAPVLVNRAEAARVHQYFQVDSHTERFHCCFVELRDL